MIEGKTICVVVPAYNEENQILHVIDTMPDFVDRIVVVNDKSSDGTLEVLQKKYAESNGRALSSAVITQDYGAALDYDRADRVLQELLKKQSKEHIRREVTADANKQLVIINHLDNGGVGASIASGYLWARENEMHCTAVMAGDGQMDPSELRKICMPIVTESTDYVKGNRLKHPAALQIVPKTRMFGNSSLSILTKIASGYWKISDTQTGYTAIGLHALNLIQLNRIYPRYGMPNDMLVKLNIQNRKITEVIIKPVYGIGEQSKMNVPKVIPTISLLLFRSFWKRIFYKYLIREFHPLFLLYMVGMLSTTVAGAYFIKIAYLWITRLRPINELTILAFLFTFLFGFQSLLFAMWMDIQDNERLYDTQ